MLWAHRQAAIAERSQKIADGAFVQFHAEKPFEFAGKVAAAPAHDLVASGVWPLLDEFDENRFLSGRQFGGAGRWTYDCADPRGGNLHRTISGVSA